MTDIYIKKFREKGILIDTNLLMLLLVGSYNEDEIISFKRTKNYIIEDYKYLTSFLAKFKKHIYTPNILTEMTNLTDSINSEPNYSFFQHIKFALSVFSEDSVSSEEIMQLKSFLKFGLADAVNCQLSDKYLVLTDDLRLYSYLANQGLPAINFNHIRDFYLFK
jgi:hypothetical protein